MNWHWYLFWIRDFFTGAKVRRAYKDINEGYLKGNKDLEQDINKLLTHAKNTTKFYENYDATSIEKFPIIDKMTIKNNYDKMLSTNYKNKKLHQMSTSGSTGTPLTIVQDKRKRTRIIAEVLFFGKLGGYTFGEKQLHLRVWVNKVKKSKIKKFLQNMITEDISNLNEQKMEEIEHLLLKYKSKKNILAYASTLDRISNYLAEKEYSSKDYNVTSIISSSEILQDETRERLKKVFNCNIVSRYSNEENGILAQECIEKKEFHLNSADYYFEFLKLDEDKPAKNGELARIIVTDLYNYALPIIRYDTGDLAIIGKPLCDVDNGKVIKEVFGRKVDMIYDTRGDILSPYIIANNMWEAENIYQFKFVQQNKSEYKIILNCTKKYEKEKQEIQLKQKFKKLLGQDANIKIEYANEIPVLASGKRKYIENLYVKNK